MSRRSRADVGGVLVSVALAVGSVGIAANANSDASSTRPSQSAEVVTGVQELLAQLEVEPEPPVRSGYSRERFRHWIDADGNGCDAREEVLIAERTAGEVGDDCAVVGGRWHSVYDETEFTAPGRLDIDHVVALGEAWDSGASGWTEERRSRYANDLGYRDALIAVSASSNRSKSDEDPATWRPPSQGVWCRFATAWTTVKVRWSLTADTAEVAAIRDMFERCRQAPPVAVTKAS